MKKLLTLIIMSFCTILVLKAQDSKPITPAKLFIEATIDPLHPSDVRGTVGFGKRLETSISYEYFKKSENEILEDVDIGLNYYFLHLWDKKINTGLGGRIGILNSGFAGAVSLKTTLNVGKHLKLAVYANYCNAQNWKQFLEWRTGLNCTF